MRALLLLCLCVCGGVGAISRASWRITRTHTLAPLKAVGGGSDDSLLEQMRRSLGATEDVLGDEQQETRQLMQGLRDLDRDPNMRANNKFLEWLSSNGVWIKMESAWGRAPHPLVISSQTEDDGETCGRGLLARESMAEGELMMTIPLDLCLTRAQAQVTFGKDVVDDEMDEYISISLLLMSEKLKGSNSRWKPYFDVLPDAAEVFPSYIWNDGDLEMLRGSPVFAASKSLRSKLEREYELLETTTFSRYPNLFPKAKFTFELFLWSFVMLFSRAARLSSKVNGEELALVPYADLMNHNAYSNTYIDAQRSGMPLISRNEEVALYSDRSYKKFEQVFINYGEKSNADLLLLYGFALERNPFNSVDISVGLSKEDPMYEKKRKFLDSSGRGAESVRFPLQASRYPSELVDFLRLLLVEVEDLGMTTLERMDFNEPISPSLERRVLQGLVGICESYLEKYPTTVVEDDLLIKDKNNFSLLSRQQRMAIKLRASEKRILESTIKAVEEELAKLPSVVAADGSIIPAGRSFDTRRTMTTVSNAKNMGAWTTDRQAKSEDKGENKEGGSIAERRRRRRDGGRS